MAYEKQEWKCGDTITADKLNHIEDGIESAEQSGGGSEPIVGVFEVSQSINFDNILFNNSVISSSNTEAQLYRLSDVLNASGDESEPTPLTISEIREAIENGAEISATLIIPTNDGSVEILLHGNRAKSYEFGGVWLDGIVMGNFLSDSINGTGYIVYAQISGYNESGWSGTIVYHTDVKGK